MKRPMGKSVRAPDSAGHKHSRGACDYRAGVSARICVWVECRLRREEPGSCERILSFGTAVTVEGDAPQDGTRAEVIQHTGNDSLTRWHICNYHSSLSLSMACAGFPHPKLRTFFCNAAGIFMWPTFDKGLMQPRRQGG